METAKPIRFWNRKYGVMCLVNLLVSISIFAHFPLFTYSIGRFGDQPALQSWCIMGLSVGMFLLGPFNAYFVDAFRRKRVCEVSLVCLIICTIVGSISSRLVELRYVSGTLPIIMDSQIRICERVFTVRVLVGKTMLMVVSKVK